MCIRDSIDIDAMEDSKYQRLLQNQYKCIKADREQIQLTAKRLRDPVSYTHLKTKKAFK